MPTTKRPVEQIIRQVQTQTGSLGELDRQRDQRVRQSLASYWRRKGRVMRQHGMRGLDAIRAQVIREA